MKEDIPPNLIPPTSNPKGVVNWLKSLSPDEIEEGRKFFFDRWNWDSGDEFDHAMFTLFEEEQKRRKLQAQLVAAQFELLEDFPSIEEVEEFLDDYQ